jgi:hypothetical protein
MSGAAVLADYLGRRYLQTLAEVKSAEFIDFMEETPARECRCSLGVLQDAKGPPGGRPWIVE